jgi:hypothetical protein
MEIVEIISYFINHQTDTIEVKFKLNEDVEDEVRVDEIPLKEADDFGYTLILEDFGFFDEDEDDEFKLSDDEVDEDELISFMNEYYLIYPEKLPSAESY